MKRVRKGGMRFWHAQAGVTAVEFAMIAPVLLLLLFGIIEFSLIMLVANIMESATNVSARLGTTSDYSADNSPIIQSIKSHAGSLIDPTKLTITSESYAQYDEIGQPEPYTDSNHNGHYDVGEPYTDVNGNGHWDPDQGTSGAGNSGDVVVYTVSYPWTITTPLINRIIGATYTITSHAVVKNEPYAIN